MDTEKNGKKLTPKWPENGDKAHRKEISERWENLKKAYPAPKSNQDEESLQKTSVLPLWHAAPEAKGALNL